MAQRELSLKNHNFKITGSDKVVTLPAGLNPRLVLGVLAVLFIMSVVFLQAAFSVNAKSRAVVSSREELSSSIAAATATIKASNPSEPSQAAAVLSALDDVSDKANQLQSSCQSYAPLVPALVPKDEQISKDCSAFSASAQGLASATADVKALATYEIDVAKATAAAFSFQRGPSRTDAAAGAAVWGQTAIALKGLKAPSLVAGDNAELSAAAAAISETLTRISQGGASPELSQRLNNEYNRISAASGAIDAKLATAQANLTRTTTALAAE